MGLKSYCKRRQGAYLDIVRFLRNRLFVMLLVAGWLPVSLLARTYPFPDPGQKPGDPSTKSISAAQDPVEAVLIDLMRSHAPLSWTVKGFVSDPMGFGESLLLFVPGSRDAWQLASPTHDLHINWQFAHRMAHFPRDPCLV